MVSLIKKLFVFCVVGIAAAYGVFYWKVSSSVDLAFTKLSQTMDARYDSLTVNLDGSVDIHGVHFFDNDLAVALDIETVSIASSHQDMFWLYRKLTRYQLPNSLNISITGVHSNISKSLLDYLDTHYVRGHFTDFMFLSCGPVAKSFLSQVYKLGYKNIEADFELSFTYDSTMDEMDARIWGGVFNVGDFDIHRSEKNAADIVMDYRNLSRLTGGKSMLTAELTDLGFNMRLSSYCAQQEGLTGEQWLSDYGQDLNAHLRQLKVQLSPTLVSAYLQYYKPASRLQLTIAPEVGVDMKALGWYEAEKIPELLQLHVSLNGKPVEIKTLGWDPHVWEEQEYILKAQVALDAPTSNLAVNQAKGSQPMAEASSEPAYHVGSIDDLEGYLGMSVRVVRSDGQVFDGELSKVDTKRFWLLKRQGIGVAQLPMSIQDIQSIEVLR